MSPFENNTEKAPWWRQALGFAVALVPLLLPVMAENIWHDWQSYAVFSVVAVVVGFAIAGRGFRFKMGQGELTSTREFDEYQFLNRLEWFAEKLPGFGGDN